MNNKYADLVELLNQLKYDPEIDCYSEMNEVCAKAADAIESLSAELEKKENGGWIKCSERMPGDNDDYEVLCCDKCGEMLIAHPYTDSISDTGFTAESDEVIMYKCVAWQPLPESYKESEEDAK